MTAARVGDSPNRVGGIDRVTGAQRYLADLPVADALHAKLVTLDCARARILGIDASEALALPGVHLVMTADDLPKPMPRYGPQYQDRPVLAVDETKYHGDPVALVVADTRDLAEAAARLVRVEHEELPAVFTVAGALAPDAPLVQDPSLRPGDRLAASNVLAEHRVGWGDVDAEAARAHVVVEGSLHLPDGDPLRDRAACVHGGARRRRHRGLEHDPAPELAPEADRGPGEDAALEGARATRRTRAAASAASSTPSTSRRWSSRRSRSVARCGWS